MKGFLRERRTRADETADRATSETDEMETQGAAERGAVDGFDDDFSSAELQEFLDADRYDVPADPVFKERLRETLWQMVKRMRRDGPGDS